ncbi:hypothetical protein GCM10010313_45070 [Streptomyces violarus]|uniref:Uncharacterized protein n=1 Tax=Streptomyces violarus TaxID=67380 RepID=A0A7W5F290_9ACTN|nr:MULTISPECIES: hypothetical protein [Streptomyces]MBB3077355.1 hypothetical protein [Streptomyces violarus]WRU01019.1 hypothetical protein VJ737_26555 [Streptomyces sp. CGMCC 4.1772]GHD16606.1 hypothetical protein GCM10010313_45070 [Streptomyces violarus]
MAETGPLRFRVSAVQFSGRLLCWSLAAAMIAAALDAALHPHVRWWGALWPLPWWLAAGSALAWIALRAREKARRRPPGGGARSDWAQAA